MSKRTGGWQKGLDKLDELIHEFYQIKMKSAIKGVPTSSLADILPQKTVADLREMAKLAMVPGAGKMKKADLVESLRAELPKETQVATKLSLLSLPQWEFFRNVLDVEALPDDQIFVDLYLIAQNFGLLQAFYHDGEMTFVVPDEVKQTCRAFIENSEFEDIGKAVILKEYAKAAVNLYGIIPLDELAAIYNSHNSDKTDEDELFQNLLIFIRETDSDFYFWDEYLVHPGFEDEDFEAVDDLAAEIEGKPWYIPEKESFLCYADEFHWEETAQSEKLERYLKTSFGFDTVDARSMTAELALTSAGEMPWQEQVDMVMEATGSFKSDAQAEKFFKLLMDLRNNSRIWSNKGHTPNELSARMGGPVLGVVAGGKRKIGRNEPCPCGSGKKYKHCCGRSS